MIEEYYDCYVDGKKYRLVPQDSRKLCNGCAGYFNNKVCANSGPCEPQGGAPYPGVWRRVKEEK